jgi:hypothetical protein
LSRKGGARARPTVASPPGRNVPGLGLAVAGLAAGERYLLFGSIDRSDGDVMLVDGFH